MYSSKRDSSKEINVSDHESKVLLESLPGDDSQHIKILTTVGDPVELMGLLCEALCTVIHGAEASGWQKDYDSVIQCQRHIERGFSDASYQVYMQVGDTCDAFKP